MNSVTLEAISMRAEVLSPLRGLVVYLTYFQGLTPLANRYRPSGAIDVARRASSISHFLRAASRDGVQQTGRGPASPCSCARRPPSIVPDRPLLLVRFVKLALLGGAVPAR